MMKGANAIHLNKIMLAKYTQITFYILNELLSHNIEVTLGKFKARGS